MKRSELIEEFEERGFHYLGSSRLARYINDGYLLDICEGEDWPFLEGVAEGTAPLEIADLRTVEYVLDRTAERKLNPIKRGRLTDDWNVDLTQTGTPEVYYLTQGTTINAFPVSAADVLEARYWIAPSKLSAADDEPLPPERFHTLIVDAAVARAYSDSDDYELRDAARKEFDEGLDQMRESLLEQQHDAPDDYVVVEDPTALRS